MDTVSLLVLVFGLVIILYVFVGRAIFGSTEDDDYETDGLEKTKIRHERGM